MLVTPQRPQRDAEVINLEAATGHEPVWRPGEGAGSGGGLAGYEGGGPSRGFRVAAPRDWSGFFVRYSSSASSRGVRSCSSPSDKSYNDRHAIAIEHGRLRMTAEGTRGIRKSNRRWQSDVIVDLVKRYGLIRERVTAACTTPWSTTAKTIRRYCSAPTKKLPSRSRTAMRGRAATR